jgi:hypothetical protein
MMSQLVSRWVAVVRGLGPEPGRGRGKVSYGARRGPPPCGRLLRLLSTCPCLRRLACRDLDSYPVRVDPLVCKHLAVERADLLRLPGVGGGGTKRVRTRREGRGSLRRGRGENEGEEDGDGEAEAER